MQISRGMRRRARAVRWPAMSPRLRIIAINDVYSLENLPRLASLVRHHRTHDPADLLVVVLAGDFVAPSLLSSLDAGRGKVDCLNHLPVTHVILGNHEDDVDVESLRARLHELHATVLMTNVRGLDDTFPTSHVLDVAGFRVGLVGVTDDDEALFRRPPFGGAHIEPANEAARRVADALLADGCACVVPITHQRVEHDRALARTEPPFPLILGGHEHDGLIEQVGRTLLTKAPSDAAKATVVDLVFVDGPWPEVRARIEPVTDYPEDRAMRARVDHHMARVRELENATLLLLEAGDTLSSVGTRARPTSLGTLICSRLRDAFGAEGAVFNGGGIRGAREYQGRLTFGDVRSEVPFENEIVVARLPGTVLRDAIASSRAHAPAEFPGYLQVDDGIRVDDANRLTHVAGEAFDPTRTYRIAVVRALFEGMDHIEPLMSFAREHPEAVPAKTTGREVKVALVGSFASMLWKQLGGFDALDEDASGHVTEKEILAAIGRAAVGSPSPLAAHVVLEALDRDHDRAVSRDEVDEGPKQEA